MSHHPFVETLCTLLECSGDKKREQTIAWLVEEVGVSNEAEFAVLGEDDLKDENGSFHGAFALGPFRRVFLHKVEEIKEKRKASQIITESKADETRSLDRIRTPSPNENDVPLEIDVSKESDETTQYGVPKVRCLCVSIYLLVLYLFLTG